MYSLKEFLKSSYSRDVKYKFKARSIEEFERWKFQFRAELGEMLGFGRMKKRGEVQLLEKVEESGYVREKFLMETQPKIFMPFYKLTPNQPNGKAMLALPAHGANKDTVAGAPSDEFAAEKIKNQPKESYGKLFVLEGYTVFCPDPPGYGERREERQRANSLHTSCIDLSNAAEALGYTLAGLYIWDMQILLDYICGLKNLDISYLTCVGFSGGGLYTLLLAAIDDRVKRAFISGYIHGYEDSVLETHHCSCNFVPKLWLTADLSDIASLIAPRPLGFENGTQDGLNGPRGITDINEQHEKINQAYKLHNAEDSLVQYVFEGGHMWYGNAHEFLKLPLIPS